MNGPIDGNWSVNMGEYIPSFSITITNNVVSVKPVPGVTDVYYGLVNGPQPDGSYSMTIADISGLASNVDPNSMTVYTGLKSNQSKQNDSWNGYAFAPNPNPTSANGTFTMTQA